MKFVNCFLALFVFHNVACVKPLSTWADYRSPSALTLRSSKLGNPNVVCKEPGLTCGRDCVNVYLCKKTENGLYPVQAETCTSGTTCSAGKCSAVPSHECSSGAIFPFVCKSINGTYADPADCKKYHYCVPNIFGNQSLDYSKNLTHIEAQCSPNYAYNTTSKYCDVPLPNNECQNYVVPVCEKPAQTGLVGANPSEYYICLPYHNTTNVLYPFLYTCPHGQRYTGYYECL